MGAAGRREARVTREAVAAACDENKGRAVLLGCGGRGGDRKGIPCGGGSDGPGRNEGPASDG